MQARQDALNQFSALPPLVPSERVGLVTTDKAWGVPGSTVLIADDLPRSILPLRTRATAAGINLLLRVIPNTQQISRWDRDTATQHLVDIFGGEGRPSMWDDWHTDTGWARAFVQGPCAGTLHREEDVWVVDASVLALGELRAGVAPLGVKVALHVDEQGPRPAWIQMQDGQRITPDDGDAWGYARLVASAAMQNFVGMVLHVINLHYIAAQSLAVLVHNFLPWEHPLHRLLYPHVAGTLAVNWSANKSFMGPNAIGVHTYAFTWKGLQQLAPIGLQAFDWAEYTFPDVFARRGTDELIRRGLYPYGEDALLIWKVIDNYVDDYLSQYYVDDAAVAADTALQVGLVGLDPVLAKPLRATTLAELRLILTRYIHMVSVEHKLVSGIAYDYFTHPYYFPTLARKGSTMNEAAPYREEAEQNIMFRYAISAMAWRMMADWTYVALDAKGAAAMRRFRSALAAAGKEIDARNARRKVPFPHLHPDGLETSVAV
jgi:hypothetical protein